ECASLAVRRFPAQISHYFILNASGPPLAYVAQAKGRYAIDADPIRGLPHRNISGISVLHLHEIENTPRRARVKKTDSLHGATSHAVLRRKIMRDKLDAVIPQITAIDARGLRVTHH